MTCFRLENARYILVSIAFKAELEYTGSDWIGDMVGFGCCRYPSSLFPPAFEIPRPFLRLNNKPAQSLEVFPRERRAILPKLAHQIWYYAVFKLAFFAEIRLRAHCTIRTKFAGHQSAEVFARDIPPPCRQDKLLQPKLWCQILI